MDSTEFLLKLIREQYKSIRQFAMAIGVPYSTVKSGINKGVGGMAVETVIKMCRALGIKVENLDTTEHSQLDIILRTDERDMIMKYRQLTETVQEDIHDYVTMKFDKSNNLSFEK